MLHCLPFISDDGEHRTLHFSIDEVQSMMCPARPFDLEVAYTKTMMGFLLTIPNPVHILMVGLGGGSIVKILPSAPARDPHDGGRDQSPCDCGQAPIFDSR
ncbi:MAG: hypothetical protein IPO19_19565 [Rhodoferax sp.]|nr:hypothetical protein [Rhodoferax sp.]